MTEPSRSWKHRVFIPPPRQIVGGTLALVSSREAHAINAAESRKRNCRGVSSLGILPKSGNGFLVFHLRFEQEITRGWIIPASLFLSNGKLLTAASR